MLLEANGTMLNAERGAIKMHVQIIIRQKIYSLVRVTSQLKVCGFLILCGLESPPHLLSLPSSTGGPLSVCLYVGMCVCVRGGGGGGGGGGGRSS